MKTITYEVKTKIFQLNIGNEVIFDDKLIGVLSGYKNTILMGLIVFEEMDNNTPIYKNWEILDTKLLLTPLSKISDEDSIEIYRMLGWNDEEYSRRNPKMRFEFYGKKIIDGTEIWDFNTSVKIYQYLQSKGYAMPYLDYSVDDLVELGVYKLKD